MRRKRKGQSPPPSELMRTAHPEERVGQRHQHRSSNSAVWAYALRAPGVQAKGPLAVDQAQGGAFAPEEPHRLELLWADVELEQIPEVGEGEAGRPPMGLGPPWNEPFEVPQIASPGGFEDSREKAQIVSLASHPGRKNEREAGEIPPCLSEVELVGKGLARRFMGHNLVADEQSRLDLAVVLEAPDACQRHELGDPVEKPGEDDLNQSDRGVTVFIDGDLADIFEWYSGKDPDSEGSSAGTDRARRHDCELVGAALKVDDRTQCDISFGSFERAEQ